MTNKEVLEGLLAGKIYKVGKTRYKIDNNGELRQSVMNTEWILAEDISFNDIQGFKLHYEPAPEKPTWWKHEFYENGAKFIVIVNDDWGTYNDCPDIVIHVKSTQCQADTIEEAVKILENIKGE